MSTPEADQFAAGTSRRAPNQFPFGTLTTDAGAVITPGQ